MKPLPEFIPAEQIAMDRGIDAAPPTVAESRVPRPCPCGATNPAHPSAVHDEGCAYASALAELARTQAELAEAQAELDAYRSRGAPTVAGPVTGGLALSAREVRTLLAITDCPAPHNVRSAVRALLGVPDGR